MPTFTVEAPDGRKVDLQGDSPPTEQELEGIFSSVKGPQPDDRADFEKEYLAKQARGPLQRLGDTITEGKNMVVGLGDVIKKGAQGLGQMASDTVDDPEKLPNNVLQTALEAGGRIVWDGANFIRKTGQNAIDHPIGALIPGGQGLYEMGRRAAGIKPSKEEIDKAFEEANFDKALAAEREKPLIPEVIGKANLGVAEALPLASVVEDIPVLGAKALTGAGKVISGATKLPVVSGTARIAGAVKDVTMGTGRTIAKGFQPAEVEDTLMAAIDPKANAINPKKTVQAVESAERSIKKILPDIPNLIEETGIVPKTAEAFDELAGHAKKSIWKEIDTARKEPIVHDLDPVADIYQQLADDPAVKTAFPDAVEKLTERAKDFKANVMTADDTENLIRRLNAQNEAFYSMPGVDRATVMNSNPLVEANIKALKTLRGMQNEALDAFGYGELKQKYGAWSELSDHAARQVVKQMKLEDRITLAEQLGWLGAVQGSPLKSAASYITGKALKYANSPDARFESFARRIGEVEPAPPRIPPPSSAGSGVPKGVPPALAKRIQQLKAQNSPMLQNVSAAFKKANPDLFPD